MIAILAAVVLQSPKVVEWLDDSVPVVSVQAVVKLPALGPKHAALLRLVSGTLGEDTPTYSKTQMADLMGRAGSRLRVTMMEDHLRIGFDVAPAELLTGLNMLGAILKESVVKPDSLQRVSDDLQFRQLTYWRQALDSHPFEPPRYSVRDVQDLIGVVFRPENVTLGVAGKLTPGAATKKWEDILASWRPVRLPKLDEFGWKPTLKPGAIEGKVSVLELRGPEFSATDAAFTTKLLALTAIGTGKASSLWRVARERLGLSYRQEAVLSPALQGFTPRFLIAHSEKEELEKKGETLKTTLLEDIKAWTEDDRRRAIGMAESYLVRGGDLSPLYFEPGRPLTRDLADQAYLQAYWRMKTGTQWNPHQLVGRMGFIELADLKQTAEEMVSKAELKVYSAH